MQLTDYGALANNKPQVLLDTTIDPGRRVDMRPTKMPVSMSIDSSVIGSQNPLGLRFNAPPPKANLSASITD